MKLRYFATAIALTGGVAAAASLTTGAITRSPTPPALEQAAVWSLPALDPPRIVQGSVLPTSLAATDLPRFANSAPGPLPAPPTARALPKRAPPLVTSSRAIAAGETLDAVLADAGLTAPMRAEAALAISAEYDLRQLQPGYEVTVVTKTDGTLRRLALAVEDGVMIEAVFGDAPETRVRRPDTEIVTLAGEARVVSSLYAALDAAGLPLRFTVDLAEMLGGTVDFRREITGGETLRVMWSEARVGDEVIGQPQLTFATLDLGDTLFEVVWPEDGSGRATIYQDSEVLRVFAQPVEGARLTSVFGRRTHPVYGNVRMHTGVDFAAPRGTPVQATAPGRIVFVGRRGGYGRVVEIAHGSNTVTRYSHLNGYAEGLQAGQRVNAGDVIGRVGSSGLTTGPNMHYEVRVNGRPTDPLSDDRLAAAAEAKAQVEDAEALLQDVRAQLADHLADTSVSATEKS